MSNDGSNTEQRERTKTVMLGADITNEIRAQLEEQKKSFLNNEEDDAPSSDDIETNIPDSFFYSVNEALDNEVKRSNYEKTIDKIKEEEEINDETVEEPQNEEKNYNVFGGGELIESQEDKEFFSKYNQEDIVESSTRTRKDTEKYASNIISDLIKEPKIIENPNASNNQKNTETYIREKEGTKVNLKADIEKKETKIVQAKDDSLLYGFLISFDKNPNGDYYELRQGKMVITNKENPSVKCLTIDDQTVSFMHAVINITEKNITLLDQFSENGTKIKHLNDEKFNELSGNSSQIFDKDVIMFGDVSFKVCLI